MNRPVFIHPNPLVLSRLTKESNGLARVTPSMVEALRWVSDHEENISGIFLCPDDSTFSAFRFLEITINYRPAVPIYLFEPTLQKQNEIARRVKSSTHVHGFFVGTESYQTLVANLKTNVTSENAPKRHKPAIEQEHQDYTTLPISDFFTGTTYPYDVFVFDSEGKKMSFFATQGSPIDGEYLQVLSQQTDHLYVKTEEIQENKKTLKEAHASLIDNKDFPSGWKTAEVMAESKELVNEIKNVGATEQVVGFAQNMLDDLFRLISNIDTEDGSVHRLIDRAKNCDRSVFCASYAMLMCKQLKFEKMATLEILGMASVLQDISLYKTPFGDLSDRLVDSLNENEMKIYFKHPTLSADLISQYTDVPQITLQVIRQQHERKDRTGFPNKSGGTQLHPMSEILSLINAFYDVSKAFPDKKEMMAEMQKSVLPHYSEAVTTAFKIVHTKL
jgi:response regulator RpfG family c-di-GMP phosphodiesterase